MNYMPQFSEEELFSRDFSPPDIDVRALRLAVCELRSHWQQRNVDFEGGVITTYLSENGIYHFLVVMHTRSRRPYFHSVCLGKDCTMYYLTASQIERESV